MTDNYIRKPTPVKAWRFDRQPQAEWPEWVREFEVFTPMGVQRIGTSLGALLIPVRNGPTIQATAGEWLVLDGKRLEIMRDEEFEAKFRPEEVQAPETTTDNAASISETVTPAQRGKKAAEPAPAEPETPAAEDAAE